MIHDTENAVYQVLTVHITETCTSVEPYTSSVVVSHINLILSNFLNIATYHRVQNIPCIQYICVCIVYTGIGGGKGGAMAPLKI